MNLNNQINLPSRDIIKIQSKLIRAAIQERCKIEIKHSDALEILAKSYGLPNWNVLSALLNESGDT